MHYLVSGSEFKAITKKEDKLTGNPDLVPRPARTLSRAELLTVNYYPSCAVVLMTFQSVGTCPVIQLPIRQAGYQLQYLGAA